MAEIARKTKRYPTALTDEESRRIELLPKVSRRGRRPKADLREGAEPDPLHGTFRRWLTDAADPFLDHRKAPPWRYRAAAKRLMDWVDQDRMAFVSVDRMCVDQQLTGYGGQDYLRRLTCRAMRSTKPPNILLVRFAPSAHEQRAAHSFAANAADGTAAAPGVAGGVLARRQAGEGSERFGREAGKVGKFCQQNGSGSLAKAGDAADQHEVLGQHPIMRPVRG
jgi:hypothetical protein